MAYKLIILLLLIIPVGKPAVKTSGTSKPHQVHQPAVLKNDTGYIQVRQFKAKAWQTYQADKDLHYNPAITQAPSLWDRFWNWLENLFPSGTSPQMTTFYKVIYGLLGCAFLVFILLKIAGFTPQQLFSRRNIPAPVPYSELIENIHEIDFDLALNNALQAHNYRLAVRLLYLSSLKQLNDTSLINWKPDKTNAAYLLELPDDEKRQQFGILTHQFEYIWYGNFAINQQSFLHTQELFKRFKQSLS